MSKRAYCAAIFHLLDDPARAGKDAWVYHADGALVVEGGHICAIGAWRDIAPKLAPETPVETFTNALITPGFIDTHVHYAQLDIIAGFGAQLMDWLRDYAFPAEQRFADPAIAAAGAEFFLDEMLRSGATSALVFATVHAQSADVLFSAALKRNMRLITGKTLMDRNAPAALLDTPESAYADSKALIEKWRGQGRLGYAARLAAGLVTSGHANSNFSSPSFSRLHAILSPGFSQTCLYFGMPLITPCGVPV